METFQQPHLDVQHLRESVMTSPQALTLFHGTFIRARVGHGKPIDQAVLFDSETIGDSF